MCPYLRVLIGKLVFAAMTKEGATHKRAARRPPARPAR